MNTNTYRIGRGMKSQDNCPLLKTLSQGGESHIIEDQHLVRDSLNKEFKNRGGQPGRERLGWLISIQWGA